MATIYLRSTDGDDGDDGSTWALAKATLQAAMTAAGAGGRVWVSQVHAETFAANVTLTSPGTSAAPLEILCGNDAAEPPTALATTATFTGSVSYVSIDFLGSAYGYGCTFEAGTVTGRIGFATAGSDEFWYRLEQCTLKPKGSGYAIEMPTYHKSARVELIDCVLTFNNAGSYIKLKHGDLFILGGSVGGTIPTTLFLGINYYQFTALLVGVDLSGLVSGHNLIDLNIEKHGNTRFVDCKLGAAVVLAANFPTAHGGMSVEVVNCDSADTNYRYYQKNYEGEIFQESTIVRTGGASDGTTPISRKLVSTANTKFYNPLILENLTVWNETIGSSVTVTVHVVTDNVTLNDDEAWLEVEYLGTSGVPIGSFIHDRMADIIATPAAQTTSTETWTTTGLGTPVKQQFAVTFTPQEKGVIRARVMLAKASTTMYVCPKLEIS